jgi:translation elongation factor EF-G
MQLKKHRFTMPWITRRAVFARPSPQAAEYRAALIEMAVEVDDDAMMAYLDGEEPSTEVLKRCIRKGTIANSFVPILCGSAFKNKVVEVLRSCSCMSSSSAPSPPPPPPPPFPVPFLPSVRTFTLTVSHALTPSESLFS